MPDWKKIGKRISNRGIAVIFFEDHKPGDFYSIKTFNGTVRFRWGLIFFSTFSVFCLLLVYFLPAVFQPVLSKAGQAGVFGFFVFLLVLAWLVSRAPIESILCVSCSKRIALNALWECLIKDCVPEHKNNALHRCPSCHTPRKSIYCPHCRFKIYLETKNYNEEEILSRATEDGKKTHIRRRYGFLGTVKTFIIFLTVLLIVFALLRLVWDPLYSGHENYFFAAYLLSAVLFGLFCVRFAGKYFPLRNPYYNLDVLKTKGANND